ncbi:MAG: porin family protein [Asticcacaulis sp.]
MPAISPIFLTGDLIAWQVSRLMPDPLKYGAHKMKTLMIAGLSALALATAGVTHAEDAAPTTPQTYGSVGIVGQSGHRTDTNLHGLNLRLGERFNPNWGVEGEAAFGTDKDTGVNGGQYRLTNKVGAYGVGYVPVGDFDLFARAGVADTQLKRPAGATKDETGTSFDYGVGAQYHVVPSYAIRADVTKSDFVNHHGSSTASTLSLVKSF